jgi:hypothetical protein
MRKEGFKSGDRVRIISDLDPNAPMGLPTKSWRDGKEALFIQYFNNHSHRYQYQVDCEGVYVVVWDIEKIESKESKTETNMEEIINIGTERLVEYYNSSTKEQKDYLNENFKLNGECTKKSLIGLRDMACSTWKPKIEANHPEVFKVEINWEDKWIQPQNVVFYRIEDDAYTCFNSKSTNSGSARKPRHAFQTENQANLMAEKCKLMVEMQNFAAVYNEGWTPMWGLDSNNYGIRVMESKLFVTNSSSYNNFVFGVTVKSKEIAEKMLEEFGARIKKFYNEQY